MVSDEICRSSSDWWANHALNDSDGTGLVASLMIVVSSR